MVFPSLILVGMMRRIYAHQYYHCTVSSTVDEVQSIQKDILLLQDPCVELHLLRSCLSVCKVNCLRRCVPTKYLINEMLSFDVNICFTLSELLNIQLEILHGDKSLFLGGICLREANRVAPAAFTATYNMKDIFNCDKITGEVKLWQYKAKMIFAS